MGNIYAVVSIGNTDNKLTQQQWHGFVEDINEVLKHYGKIHFFGGASTWAPWQNVAWIVEVEPKDIDALGDEITRVRTKYKQDSAFMLIGERLFL